MIKCKECEHFEVKSHPYRYTGLYTEPGTAICKKHDLVVDWFKKKKLDELECVEVKDVIKLGELLKPCPFCGRKMEYHENRVDTKNGIGIVYKYFMHEGDEVHDDCILDSIKEPFEIGAGDARPEEGYVGEYGLLWNKRAEDLLDDDLK